LIPVAVHIWMRRWDGQMTFYDCPGIKKPRTEDNHFLLPVTMNTIVLCWLGFFLYIGLVGIFLF